MDNGKVVSTKTVYKSKFFKVEEQEIVLSNKKKLSYSIVKRDPVVVVIPITSDNEIFLVSQYRTLHRKQTLEAVAGHVDKGETPLEAAKRELKEEAGIEAMHWEEIAKMDVSGSIVQAEAHVFLARDLKIGEASPDDEEDITLIKLPLEDAVKKVLSQEISTASSMTGILMLDKLLGKKKL